MAKTAYLNSLTLSNRIRIAARDLSEPHRYRDIWIVTMLNEAIDAVAEAVPDAVSPDDSTTIELNRPSHITLIAADTTADIELKSGVEDAVVAYVLGKIHQYEKEEDKAAGEFAVFRNSLKNWRTL